MKQKKPSKHRFKNGRAKKGLNFLFTSANKEFFQNTAAEREENLNDYYVDNEYFQSATDPNSKKAFFIGRTGVGKTAILEKIKRSPRQNIISINPEDFAFKIMERSAVLKQLTDWEINLDLFYKTMWKYIFVTEILKQIYGNQKKSWFEEQVLKWKSDSVAIRAYNFLQRNDELESGISFNEKIEKIVEKLECSVQATGISFEFKVGYSPNKTLTKDEEKRIYNAIKQFEFTDINYFIKHLDQNILNKYDFIILVDDLDKNWIQNEIGINFTRCLFETIFDINNSKHLRLLVSLRTNLFNQLKFNQREKFSPYIDYIFWNDEKMKEIVEKRFKAIVIDSYSDIWEFIFPEEITVGHQKRQKTFDYLLRRSNMRPRDILLFISYAIGNSIGKNKITMDAMIKAEETYSKDRLNALEDEWQNPYINIGKIFNFFRRCFHKLDKESFYAIMEDITLDVLEKEEQKNLGDWLWIVEGSYIKKDDKNFDSLKLIDLLYKMGFIGIKETPSSKTRYIHDGQGLDMPYISEDTKFYINPCYHRALAVTFH